MWWSPPEVGLCLYIFFGGLWYFVDCFVHGRSELSIILCYNTLLYNKVEVDEELLHRISIAITQNQANENGRLPLPYRICYSLLLSLHLLR